MIITLVWALLWKALSCIHSHMVPTVSVQNETSIKSQGRRHLFFSERKGKWPWATAEEKLLFHQVSGHPSWSVFSWSLRSCPPPDRPVTAEVRAQCLIRPLRISLAQGCGQMQTKHRNAAETSALALLSNHECICNLNRQPVGNENNSMESAVDAQEWQSRGMAEMETHDWVTSSTQHRNGKVLKGQFTRTLMLF